MKKLFTAVALLLSLIPIRAISSNVISIDYSTTNVSSTAYVQLTGSTAQTTSKLQLCDTSGQAVKLAQGASGAEVDLDSIPVNGCITIQMGLVIPFGTRLSLRALKTSATSGLGVISLLP